MALLVLLGIAMTAASIAVIHVGNTEVRRLIGWAGAALFGAVTLFLLWRAFTVQGPTVVVSPAGLLDLRVTGLPVPWSAVSYVGGLTMSGQRMVYVGLSKEVFETLEPTRIARMTWAGNRAIVGVEGIPVSTQDLSVRHEALFDLISAFAKRYGN